MSIAKEVATGAALLLETEPVEHTFKLQRVGWVKPTINENELIWWVAPTLQKLQQKQLQI